MGKKKSDDDEWWQWVIVIFLGLAYYAFLVDYYMVILLPYYTLFWWWTGKHHIWPYRSQDTDDYRSSLWNLSWFLDDDHEVDKQDQAIKLQINNSVSSTPTCTACGEINPNGSQFCTNCGSIVMEPKKRSRHIKRDIMAEVMRRDNGTCQICSSTQELEFGHIIPFSQGGANTVNNLQIECKNCNLSKGASV